VSQREGKNMLTLSIHQEARKIPSEDKTFQVRGPGGGPRHLRICKKFFEAQLRLQVLSKVIECISVV
jgi:hypothetical protein